MDYKGYVHTVTFLHGVVLFHNPKGIPVYFEFQTIENDAKTLPCAHSQKLHNRSARIITKCENEHGQSSLALGLMGWQPLKELTEGSDHSQAHASV